MTTTAIRGVASMMIGEQAQNRRFLFLKPLKPFIPIVFSLSSGGKLPSLIKAKLLTPRSAIPL
jgi:hypothetical protein